MRSMTGFGRGSASGDNFSVTVELKTVNNRPKDASTIFSFRESLEHSKQNAEVLFSFATGPQIIKQFIKPPPVSINRLKALDCFNDASSGLSQIPLLCSVSLCLCG